MTDDGVQSQVVRSLSLFTETFFLNETQKERGQLSLSFCAHLLFLNVDGHIIQMQTIVKPTDFVDTE